MGSDDKRRQIARHLRGSARDAERRENQRARKQARKDGDDAPRGRRPTRTGPLPRHPDDDWGEDAFGVDDSSTIERFGPRRTPRRESPRAVEAGGSDGAGFAGTVVARHRDAVEVALDRRVAAGDARTVRVPTRPRAPELVVGDSVELTVDVRDGGFRVARVFARRTQLDRPDPVDPRARLVVAANVDIVVAVQSADRPRPGLVDRIAIATRRGGAALLVCLNKLDLATAEFATELATLRTIAAEQDAPWVEVSARTGAGLDDLRAHVAGRCCVFVGPSGVGKSSLCNALDPSLDLRVADVRAADRKGRHTTTASSLHRLPPDIVVIDTPGVRAFGLGEVSADELAAAFPDIVREGQACRYRDCGHATEPDCGVQTAIADGRLPATRLAAWRRVRTTSE